MTKPHAFPIWPVALAVGFNGLMSFGCAVLFVEAPNKAAALGAAAGTTFFGLAAAAFLAMLRLRLAAR